ncbi:MAG TPA: hypothetical protein VF585_01150 [Chthoniobacterales bacterium]|jgi:hypothetical protein
MAASSSIVTAIFLSVACLHAAEPVLPAGHPPERYERIWKKSPFTVASVLAPEPVDTSTFADTLTLVGLVTIGGKPLVTVVANDSQETQLIEADKPNAEGIQVASFINDLDPAKVEVVLRKGENTGTLRFAINQAGTSQPPMPNTVPQPRVIQPRTGTPPSIPAPTQPRVIPGTAGPVMPAPGPQIIRRRQLQLPGANRPNVPVAPNTKSNAIPPP